MLRFFLFSNIFHFGINVFSFFAFFSTALLYLDSWNVNRKKKTPLVRCIGFILLSLSSLYYATTMDIGLINLFINILKITGLTLIITSLIKEPILKKPSAAIFLAFPILSLPKNISTSINQLDLERLNFSLLPLLGILFLITGIIYLRKTYEGLEKQLKLIGVAFILLSVSEMIRISFLWSESNVVFFSKLLSDYSYIWYFEHVIYLIGIIVLSIWSWGYLRFRIQAQLFISTFASTLLIFITTTFLFTLLILKNMENDALSHLKTDSNVFQYTLENLQLEALSDSQSLTYNSDFITHVSDNDTENLYKLTSEYLVSQNLSFITIASSSGQVLVRAEDKDKRNDSIKSDPLFESANNGQSLSTLISIDSIPTPNIAIKSAVPIKEKDKTIGVILSGYNIDNSFVDGIKEITGLDSTIFLDNKRVATTFFAPDGITRYMGTLEPNKDIIDKVLIKGQSYFGENKVINQSYLTSYSPLKTYQDKTIGMLFVGKPSITLYQSAEKSIEVTFLGSVILILISIIPSYLFSKYLKSHLEA